MWVTVWYPSKDTRKSSSIYFTHLYQLAHIKQSQGFFLFILFFYIRNCASAPPTPQESPRWGLARRKAPAPEMKAAGLGRAVGAAYQPANTLAASGEQRMSSTQPQACFKSVCWLHWGVGGSQLLPVQLEAASWQSAGGRQAREDQYGQSCLHAEEDQHEFKSQQEGSGWPREQG